MEQEKVNERKQGGKGGENGRKKLKSKKSKGGNYKKKRNQDSV